MSYSSSDNKKAKIHLIVYLHVAAAWVDAGWQFVDEFD